MKSEIKEVINELRDLYPPMAMSLSLTPREIIVINEMLMNTKLGISNEWEEAIALLMKRLEDGEHYTFMNALQEKYGRPLIFVETEDEFGVTLRLENKSAR